MANKLSIYFYLINSFFISIVCCYEPNLVFPESFRFGVATSAYQIEGAWNVSGKSESIWDYSTHTFPHLIADGTNGDIACDSYHKTDVDIENLKLLNAQFYRFSINWPRLLPTGGSNFINPDGVRYYNEVIDKLLANGIEPMITLYHWDLPQCVQDLGGWTNSIIIDYFAQFARVCFALFGDRVKTWITVNEPYNICANVYEITAFAPFRLSKGVGTYLCGHNVLLAHAKAYHIYKDEFYATQQGKVGITIESPWYQPLTDSPQDKEAADRALQMRFGWFVHPILSSKGDYPEVMRQRIDLYSQAQGYMLSRLPNFTRNEIVFIRNSTDFLGLNHYTSHLVTQHAIHQQPDEFPSYANDLAVEYSHDESWNSTGREDFKVYPEGLRLLLGYIKATYGNPTVLITENGYAGFANETLEDDGRVQYYNGYLKEVLKALLLDNCNIQGYTAWSFMDNYEWMDGYTLRFGFFHVNFTDALRPRTPKKSALVYKNIIMYRTIEDDFHDL